MNQHKKAFRLRYFIKSGLQIKFLRVNILLAIFLCLAVSFSVYQLSMNVLGRSLEEIYPPGLLKGIYTNLDKAFGVRLLLIMLVVIVATFFTSHRVAGPAYHIERDLAEMAEGDLTKRIHLRKHDELKPIATELNKMLDLFSHKLNSIKDNLEAMEKLYRELTRNEIDTARRRDIAEKLGASLKGVRDTLSEFKL